MDGSRIVELAAQAAVLVRSGIKPSTPSIQRHLKLGYTDAHTIIQCLERSGVVTPPDDCGRREVVPPEHAAIFRKAYAESEAGSTENLTETPSQEEIRQMNTAKTPPEQSWTVIISTREQRANWVGTFNDEEEANRIMGIIDNGLGEYSDRRFIQFEAKTASGRSVVFIRAEAVEGVCKYRNKV